MTSLNNSDKPAADGRYPDETALNDTYRTLEGFNSLDVDSSSEMLTVENFNRLAKGTVDKDIKAVDIDSDIKTVATIIGNIALALLISSITLGLAVTQLSTSIKHLIDAISLHPIDFVRPHSNH